MKKRLISILMIACLLVASCVAEGGNWYADTSLELARCLGELVRDEAYLKLYTSSEEVRAAMEPLKSADFGRVRNQYLVDLSGDLLLKLNEVFGDGEELDAGGLSDCGMERLRATLPASIAGAMNASQGATCIAAASILSFSRSYPMPEAFSPCLILLEADGAAVCVAFAQTGEGVVTATANPLFPPEGKSAAKYLSELTENLSAILEPQA